MDCKTLILNVMCPLVCYREIAFQMQTKQVNLTLDATKSSIWCKTFPNEETLICSIIAIAFLECRV